MYAPGGSRILSAGHPLYRPLLRDAYDQFIWPGVADDHPQQVWVIGSGIAGALAGLPGIESSRSISQPQAPRTRDQRDRFHEAFETMCDSVWKAAP
jgi:hypothetical protein